MVRELFMKLVPPEDHKFVALHGAVWSGGSYVYVPEGVHLDIPLQSYFRLNAPGAGQFEHTLIIVEKGAVVRYSILMPGTIVKAGAVVEYAILAENAAICENAHVGASPDGSDSWGVAVVAQNLRVGEGAVVPPKAMITRNVKGGAVK